MVPGKRQRQDEPGRELLPVPAGLEARSRRPQDGHFGRVDDGRKAGAADAAERGNREGAALHVGGLEFAVARPGREVHHLASNVEDALDVDVADDRNQQPAGRVGGKADVVVLLQHQFAAVDGGVQTRVLFQHERAGLDDERQDR